MNDGEPLEIELWGDDDEFGSSTDEVTVAGGGFRRGGPLLAGLGLIVAAVVAGGALAGDSDDPAQQPAPTTTAPPPPIAGGFERRRTRDGLADATLFTTDPGWRVYLSSGEGALRSYDPATGVVRRVNDRNVVTAVVPGPTGPYPLGSHFDQYARVHPRRDATGWTMLAEDGPTVLLISLEDGAVLGEIEPIFEVELVGETTFFDATVGSLELLGTDGSARPVLRTADGRAATLAADGTLVPWADRVVSEVELGQYVEYRCTNVVCGAVVHHDGGELAWELTGAFLAADFAPDRRHAAIVFYDPNEAVFELRVTDLETGRYSSARYPTLPLAEPRLAGFSPDSRYFFFTAAGVLSVFDVGTGEIVELATGFDAELYVAEVA